MRSIAIGALLGALLQAAPSTGMVLYWPLDETAGTTANDAAGANDGTHAGGPTPSSDRPALLFTNDSSLSFDGTDDAVARATVTGVATGNTPHTIAAWIKVLALPANRAWIALLGNAGAGAHHWLINAAGTTQFGVWGGTGQKQPVLAADGAWRHVAVTFDGTDLAAYVDGTEVGTPIPATFNLQGVPFTLGQAHNGENFFNGILDDVRIYDRALSAAEVQYLAAGNGPPAVPLNLTALPQINAIRLDWEAVSGADSYTLRRTTSLTDPNPPVVASGITALTYTDTGLNPNTRYYYVVTAFHSAGGESGFSNVADAVPLPTPPRTNDHGEGLFDDRCSCGSTASPALPFWAAALIGLAALAARRRRPRPATGSR